MANLPTNALQRVALAGRQVALSVFLAAALFYAPVFAASFAFVVRTPIIDAQEAPGTIYPDSVHLLVYQLHQLRRSGHPQILLVGASNVREGFRPRALMEALPGTEAHNLAIGADNFTQLRQILSAAHAELGDSGFSRSTVVVGVWYGLFTEDRVRWPSGTTLIQDVFGASRLYDVSSGAPLPLVAPEHMDATVTGLRPYLLWMKGRGEVSLFKQWLTALRGGGSMVEKPVVDERYKRAALTFWDEYLQRPGGTLSDEQFGALAELAQWTVAQGARLVVVDLPVPHWHQERSPFFADYQSRKRATFDRLRAMRGVHLLDFQNLMSDDDFRDSAHPTAEAAVRWSATLAAQLRALN